MLGAEVAASGVASDEASGVGFDAPSDSAVGVTVVDSSVDGDDDSW